MYFQANVYIIFVYRVVYVDMSTRSSRFLVNHVKVEYVDMSTRSSRFLVNHLKVESLSLSLSLHHDIIVMVVWA